MEKSLVCLSYGKESSNGDTRGVKEKAGSAAPGKPVEGSGIYSKCSGDSRGAGKENATI